MIFKWNKDKIQEEDEILLRLQERKREQNQLKDILLISYYFYYIYCFHLCIWFKGKWILFLISQKNNVTFQLTSYNLKLKTVVKDMMR